MIPTEILERVARGAELLDRVKPDWFEVVTPERLRMELGDPEGKCGCVLTLNYGTFPKGVEELGWFWPSEEAYDYGLDDEDGEYEHLDAAWLEEADRRRAAKP